MYRTNSLPKILIKTNQNMRSATAIKCSRNVITSKDLPHPRSLPVIGTKLDLFAAGGGSKLHEYIDMRHKQLGPIFCEKLSDAEIVFVSDPQLMKLLFLKLEGRFPKHILPEPWILYEKLYGSKRGLFFMDGEEWLVNRRIVNKHLLREDSERWLEEPLKRTITKFIEKLKANIENGESKLDLETDLYKLTTESVISVLLGSNSSLEENKYFDELLEAFSGTVKNIFKTTTELFGLPVSLCQRLHLRPWTNFKESVDGSIFLAHKLVKEMLTKRNQNTGLIKRLCEDQVPDETIMRIVADFVIAAGDTTSFTTLWTLFLLSKNREVVDELRHGANVKNVIKESMRLYPVAPFLTRILPKSSTLGSYTLNEGQCKEVKEPIQNTEQENRPLIENKQQDTEQREECKKLKKHETKSDFQKYQSLMPGTVPQKQNPLTMKIECNRSKTNTIPKKRTKREFKMERKRETPISNKELLELLQDDQLENKQKNN